MKRLLLFLALAACEAPAAADRGGDCASCHMDDYKRADDPVHVEVKPTKCAVCHEQSAWRPMALHHEWYPLTGAHAAPSMRCAQCHATQFKGTSRECVACHEKDRAASTFPGHAGFGTKCADCHSTSAFKPSIKPPPILTAPPPAPPPPLKPGQKPPPPPRTTAPPPPRPPPDVTTRPSPRR